MHERMSWTPRSIVRIGAAPFAPPHSGSELSRATAASYTAAMEGPPLNLEDAAWFVAGMHPSLPEAGDDLTLIDAQVRVLARMKEDVDRGKLSQYPTLIEALEWAISIGLGLNEEARAIATLSACARSSPSMTSRPRAADKPTLRNAEYDPILQRRAEGIARRLIAQGSPAPKKAVAALVKRELGGKLSESAIIRRTRSAQ